MNIIIFKTSVRDKNDLSTIRRKMDNLLGTKNWTFALEDEDKILRVVSASSYIPAIRKILMKYGFICEELPYSLDEFKV
ncbi:hypothetical protein CPT03_10150 [Pedobacter ginsengisoli]|uniref:HMA domain-containing protein n=1 Tax=Pedobacter ginsengisoli TaxID=363852 RepID=A0A2D1U5B4_9SPHI|nr:hypothetical protein [Pedobacter ginsengisoli]ATP56810.1 hypothetical protein CPT03_10150 [Pedobacter ginsengisoli]